MSYPARAEGLVNSTKWYMHKRESAQEIEMHKILWDLEIQMDHLIRRPDQVLIDKKGKKKKKKEKKRTCLVDFAVPAIPREKIKKKKLKE